MWYGCTFCFQAGRYLTMDAFGNFRRILKGGLSLVGPDPEEIIHQLLGGGRIIYYIFLNKADFSRLTIGAGFRITGEHVSIYFSVALDKDGPEDLSVPDSGLQVRNCFLIIAACLKEGGFIGLVAIPLKLVLFWLMRLLYFKNLILKDEFESFSAGDFFDEGLLTVGQGHVRYDSHRLLFGNSVGDIFDELPFGFELVAGRVQAHRICCQVDKKGLLTAGVLVTKCTNAHFRIQVRVLHVEWGILKAAFQPIKAVFQVGKFLSLFPIGQMGLNKVFLYVPLESSKILCILNLDAVCQEYFLSFRNEGKQFYTASYVGWRFAELGADKFWGRELLFHFTNVKRFFHRVVIFSMPVFRNPYHASLCIGHFVDLGGNIRFARGPGCPPPTFSGYHLVTAIRHNPKDNVIDDINKAYIGR